MILELPSAKKLKISKMQKKKKKKKNWMESTTHKIPKSVAKNLCKKLIQKTSMH